MLKKYTNLVIFYFSGTGNAKRVAEWFAGVASEMQIPFEIINIADFNNQEMPDICKNTLVGFCSPTHGFNFPPIVLKFITRFPKSAKADIFIINTRAGMKLYKLFLPGLSGVTQFLAAIILKMKGYRIVGMQPMDLPSNWISLHPGLRKKVVFSIFHRCKTITREFASKIMGGGKKYKAFLSLPFDIAVTPVALAYYIAGRFALAKTFVATSKCNQCNLCIKQCPVKAIKMFEQRPYWTFNCESCMHCMNNCPNRAIETAFGYTFIIWWVIFSFVPVWIISFIFKTHLNGIIELPVIYWLCYNIIYIFAFLCILFISYHLLHFLMRFAFFDRLVAYTSFTRFKWWRRYKAPVE